MPPPRTTYHAYKLKLPAFQEIYFYELEKESIKLIPILQDILDKPPQCPQAATDKTCELVQHMIQTVAFATLGSPSHLHTHDQLNTQPQSKRKKRSDTPPPPKPSSWQNA